MILHAFAAHPDYRNRLEIIAAGQSLKERFFQPDKYNDLRQTVKKWKRKCRSNHSKGSSPCKSIKVLPVQW
jgi:hypothetical protein